MIIKTYHVYCDFCRDEDHIAEERELKLALDLAKTYGTVFIKQGKITLHCCAHCVKDGKLDGLKQTKK
jgi:hypothetical protein